MNSFTLSDLYKIIQQRKVENSDASYVAKLLNSGEEKVLKKVHEECFEVLYAASSQKKSDLVEELSDLLFHLLVMMNYKDVSLDEVLTTLNNRHQQRTEE